MKEHSILIIGGGLAGLCAAVHLAMEGLDVAVLEKQTYPHHKVCGEYVSKEVEPYLERLGIDLRAKGAIEITRFSMSAIDGYNIETELPLGGFGISRYAFDNYLYLRAKELGVIFCFEKVMFLTTLKRILFKRVFLQRMIFNKILTKMLEKKF